MFHRSNHPSSNWHVNEWIYWVHRTCERNETYQYYVNCGHTNEWRCDYDIILIYCFIPFTGTMNSINWPAPNVWVFIAQLVEHCSANAEATGLNPVEAPKTFFGLNLQFLKSRSQLLWSHRHSLILYFPSSHNTDNLWPLFFTLG